MIGWAETKVGWARLELASGLVRALELTKVKPKTSSRASFPRELVDAMEACVSGYGIPPILDVKGTPFQRKVWNTLSLIPYGETRTYQEIAEEMIGGSHARAVATACSRNAIAVLIPCHRVVGKREIGGYRWGTENKRSLLEWERRGGHPRDFLLSFWRSSDE